MPEHVHLLLSEPARSNPSVVMQALKQGFARRVRRHPHLDPRQGHLWSAKDAGPVWQRRFYDFVVWSEHKRVEKLRYMHRNPVKRRLVMEPDQWRWSSFRFYAYGETGLVLINEQKKAELEVRAPGRREEPCLPPFEHREGCGSHQ
jgi:putative transposase